MFVDASAIVAILASESEAMLLADALQAARTPITSPLAVYEAVLAVGRIYAGNMTRAETVVSDFIDVAGIKIVPVTRREGVMALAAFVRFGKERGHPAQLNMGDCFAYASAREAGCSLLFKGCDFSCTDIPSALAP